MARYYIYSIKGKYITSTKGGEFIPLTELTGIEFLPEEGWAVGIYMSPLDVHYNYAPIAGKVTYRHRVQSSLNLPMVDLLEYLKIVYLRSWINLFSRKYHLQNERVSIIIEGDVLQVGVIEIADKFVNKITNYIKLGEEVKLGQKIGFISRGSQVDLLIFNKDVKIIIEEGQQVYGALMIIARINGFSKA